MKSGCILTLMIAGPIFAQPKDSNLQLTPTLSVRVIAPDAMRYAEGAPIVVHIGQMGKDVPARLSPFGFVDVILPQGATSADASEVFANLQSRLRPPGMRLLYEETGAIAWSKSSDTALTAIAATGHNLRWYVSEGGKASSDGVRATLATCPKLGVIIWASETDSEAFSQYAAFQSASVRWIRLNAAAQYLGEITGRNAPHLPENSPNARFDRETVRAALALDPANGGNASSLGVTAGVLELADRTHRADW